MHPNTPYTKYFDNPIACSDCDLLLPQIETPVRHSIVCPRCGKTISRRRPRSITKALTLSIAGLLLYLPAITLPLMTMRSFGFSDSASIIESISNFYQSGYYFVSFMVLLSAVILPFVLLASIFIISGQLCMKRFPPYLAKLFRRYLQLEEWAMVEVYMLGIMVTIIKMADSTNISYHAGVFCFTGLVLLTLSIAIVIDRDFFWQTIDRKGKKDQPVRSARYSLPKGAPGGEFVTAARQGLTLCHTCHKLSPTSLEGKACPRCGQTLHNRKPYSISRTWALVLTASIFLAPANLLPIMQINYLGIPDPSTILDGIIYFFQHGSVFIGLIIFTASVLIPVFKIVGLVILLLSTHPCGTRLLRQKARMFRFISFIGRWSMLDIFVIALLSALLNFGFFTSVHVAPAATYFCIVVASTMLAVITFDPRIIWDKCSPCQHVVNAKTTLSISKNTP